MNKKNLNRVGLIIFFGFIVFGLIVSINRSYKLRINHKYTIGFLYKTGGGARSDIDLYFKYNVNNKSFDVKRTPVSGKFWPDKIKIGKRYYVIYEVNNPENSELLTDYSVADSIKEAPVNGWDKLPDGTH